MTRKRGNFVTDVGYRQPRTLFPCEDLIEAMSRRGVFARTRKVVLLVVLATAGVLALSGSASAALKFRPCSGEPDVGCGRVVVPFDQTGVVRGALSLHVERMHTDGSNKGTMIALAGGPGQAATPFLGDF